MIHKLEARDYEILENGIERSRKLLQIQQEFFDKCQNRGEVERGVPTTQGHTPYGRYEFIDDEISIESTSKLSIVIRYFSVLTGTLPHTILMSRNAYRQATVCFVLQKICNFLEDYNGTSSLA